MNFINTLTSNWNVMRVIRLGLAIFVGVHAFQQADIFAGIVASLFLLQAITNTGCCGSTGCAVPPSHKTNSADLVEYEEVGTKNAGDKPC